MKKIKLLLLLLLFTTITFGQKFLGSYTRTDSIKLKIIKFIEQSSVYEADGNFIYKDDTLRFYNGTKWFLFTDFNEFIDSLAAHRVVLGNYLLKSAFIDSLNDHLQDTINAYVADSLSDIHDSITQLRTDIDLKADLTILRDSVHAINQDSVVSDYGNFDKITVNDSITIDTVTTLPSCIGDGGQIVFYDDTLRFCNGTEWFVFGGETGGTISTNGVQPKGLAFFGDDTTKLESDSTNLRFEGDTLIATRIKNTELLNYRLVPYGTGKSVFIGDGAGRLDDLTDNLNIFEGYQAGYTNTSGSGNVFQGYRAGFSNTTGYQNIFQGYRAGFSNTTGLVNTFQGYQAGFANTEGYYNVFIGYAAGDNCITGHHNVLIGFNLDLPTTSTDNYISIGDLYFGLKSSNYAGININSPQTYFHTNISESGTDKTAYEGKFTSNTNATDSNGVGDWYGLSSTDKTISAGWAYEMADHTGAAEIINIHGYTYDASKKLTLSMYNDSTLFHVDGVKKMWLNDSGLHLGDTLYIGASTSKVWDNGNILTTDSLEAEKIYQDGTSLDDLIEANCGLSVWAKKAGDIDAAYNPWVEITAYSSLPGTTWEWTGGSVNDGTAKSTYALIPAEYQLVGTNGECTDTAFVTVNGNTVIQDWDNSLTEITNGNLLMEDTTFLGTTNTDTITHSNNTTHHTDTLSSPAIKIGGTSITASAYGQVYIYYDSMTLAQDSVLYTINRFKYSGDSAFSQNIAATDSGLTVNSAGDYIVSFSARDITNETYNDYFHFYINENRYVLSAPYDSDPAHSFMDYESLTYDRNYTYILQLSATDKLKIKLVSIGDNFTNEKFYLYNIVINIRKL